MADVTRRVAREESWRERIEEQGLSGQRVRDFCKERQISPSVFYAWKKKLESIGKWPLGRRFMRVKSEVRSAMIGANIHLPNGVRIELGGGLESWVVSEFIRGLCGVNHAKS